MWSRAAITNTAVQSPVQLVRTFPNGINLRSDLGVFPACWE
jgi:hypothetical protein